MAVICTLNSYGQGFVFGAKAGFTNTQIVGADFNKFEVPSATNGFLIGAFARVSFIGFYVQPEVCYRNLNFTVTNNNVIVPISSVSKLNYIDVPVMFGKKILKFINISAGPNFQFLANQNLSSTNVTTLDVGKYNDFVIGAQFGVGIEFWKLCLDVRHDFSINTIGNTAALINNTQNIDFSSRVSMFQYTIGYKFVDL